MIFSRKRGSEGRRSADDPLRPGRHTRDRRADDRAAEESLEAQNDDLDDATAVAERGYGPYDLDDAPHDDVERVDLGALQIPAVPGVEIRLQADPEGDITGLVLAHDASQLQLGVFAAPRTEGIWDEIRELIRSSLASGGARPEEIAGDYGVEVRARVRDESSGATTIVRHLGVDGPRWFVHATMIGAAAADPSASGQLREVLRGLVVNRGTEARPVREALPMRLPPQAAQQLEAAAAAEAAEAAEAAGSETMAGPNGVAVVDGLPKPPKRSPRPKKA